MLLTLKVVYTIVAFVCCASAVSAQTRCRNPNRNNGVCISIYDCPQLLSIIAQKPLPEAGRRFLLAAQCSGGSGSPPYVCCNEDSRLVAATTTTRAPTTTRRPRISPSNGRGNVLPMPPECGRETAGNRIYGGNATELDEFPWMALLIYRSVTGSISINCGGSLINQRYVLTAAHCVMGEIVSNIGPLYIIRLGEYDTSKTVDCIDNDCADPVIEVGYESIDTHEQFDQNSNHRHHDIALIRLNQDISYTYFIKPVCLPFALNFQRSDPGATVVVAGWGRTLRVSQSPKKQKLEIPVTQQRECIRKFTTKNVNIIDSQLCAGGAFAEDSCDGDSGGPLMKIVQKSWVLEGIISFGNRCGLEGWPAVYTRVSSYEEWIRRTIRS